jgi:hypothetical protein
LAAVSIQVNYCKEEIIKLKQCKKFLTFSGRARNNFTSAIYHYIIFILDSGLINKYCIQAVSETTDNNQSDRI